MNLSDNFYKRISQSSKPATVLMQICGIPAYYEPINVQKIQKILRIAPSSFLGFFSQLFFQHLSIQLWIDELITSFNINIIVPCRIKRHKKPKSSLIYLFRKGSDPIFFYCGVPFLFLVKFFFTERWRYLDSLKEDREKRLTENFYRRFRSQCIISILMAITLNKIWMHFMLFQLNQ